MRRGLESRFTGWVDLVGELLLTRQPRVPVELVLRELGDTFDTFATWHWADPDGSFGFHVNETVPGWPDAARMEAWGRSRMYEHPLFVWFGRTGDLTAMTLGRVPAASYSSGGLEIVQEELRPVALDQQLSIPYRAGGGHQRAFVLCTTGADFDEQRLLLARRIQPLLVLVGRQAKVLAECSGAETLDRASSIGLTGREIAVLELLAQGLTAIAIGRALGIASRTVHVHLDHLYRKLSVHDRLMAVTTAKAAGLLLDIDRAGPDGFGAETPSERRFSWCPNAGLAHAAGVP